MKKVFVLCAVLILTATSVFADNALSQSMSSSKRVESTSFSGEPAVGKFKLGVMAGYPSGVTVGLRPSDKIEFNATVGTSYLDFTIGANLLFTLVDIDIAGQLFPLSLGPAVNVNFPLSWASYGLLNRTFSVDAMAALRWEYSFQKFPLNLFAEIAAGVKFGGYTTVGLGWNSAVGARFIF